MDFLFNQTCPDAILADYLESERLGQELLDAGCEPIYEIVPPAGKFHTFVIGRWKVINGEIKVWLEQVTEQC